MKIKSPFRQKAREAEEVFAAQIFDDLFNGKKLHLRIDKKGEGTLSVDASRILYLNHVATDYMRFFLQDQDTKHVVKKILKKYHVDEKTAKEDFTELKAKIVDVSDAVDVCPIAFHDVEPEEPFSTETHPLRVDLALTYRCNNECGHCYSGKEGRVEELATEEWKQVIEKLWRIGVPHVTFTGGEATLRDDLVELVQYAQDLGVVCGLVTNGRKLADEKYVKDLVDAGIDYFQITIESDDAKVHDKMVGVKGAWKETVEGLKNAIATPIYTLTNTTITTLNRSVAETIDFLASLKKDNQRLEVFAMNSLIYSGKAVDVAHEIGIREEELEPILHEIIEKAEEHEMKFIWYTPTEYCTLNPMELGLGLKRCSAAHTSSCIEPNGDVIPCQSYFEPAGNLLRDKWDDIWNSKLFRKIRNRRYLRVECYSCEDLDTCGGGCPLYEKSKSLLCANIRSAP